MPLVRHRLDCCICIVHQNEESIADLENLFGVMTRAQQEGNPLPCVSFFSCSLEHSENVRLYANHQGGYRVRCPFCSSNVAAEFSKSVHYWRSGGEFSMSCSSCTQTFALSLAQGYPPFAFSRAAIVLHDVQEAEIGSLWKEKCTQMLKEYRVIFRRVG